ncbi:hypothetical protein DINM_004098 [Dirofilaria immitis]|nr:hypothetical protein [Dirofilaria immitis]
MERALDVTDQFLHTVLQDKNRLQDPNFMMYLMSVRQKHKKTFAVIDEVYDLSTSSKSTSSLKISHTDIIDQQCCVISNSSNSVHADDGKDTWIADNKRKLSRSVQSLVQTQENHKWYEEQQFNYANEWSPQITTTYSWRFMNELMEKKKIEEMEEKERITFLRNKAREVPRSTYEPRYQQLCEKEEQLGTSNAASKAAEMLEKVRFPRTVAKFESGSFHLRRCISADASDWKKREVFKAKAVPLSVYVSPYKNEIQECKGHAER